MLGKPSSAGASDYRIRIQASRGWVALGLAELWSYRELIYFLIWRDIKVRYKQTILGMLWAVIQPILTMVVFSIFFGRMAGVPSDGVPYPIFSFAGLVPWTYFANGVNSGSSSLVTHARVITKIYFPRMALPLAAVLAPLVDFGLSFLVLLGMMIVYRVPLSPRIFTLPLFLVLAIMSALGVSLWLAAMNVQFRDIRYAIPFLIQILLFLTPVIYPSSVLDEPWRTLYAINPMVSVIEGFRWALLGTEAAPGLKFIVSFTSGSIILISGSYYFRRLEKTFADVV